MYYYIIMYKTLPIRGKLRQGPISSEHPKLISKAFTKSQGVHIILI